MWSPCGRGSGGAPQFKTIKRTASNIMRCWACSLSIIVTLQMMWSLVIWKVVNSPVLGGEHWREYYSNVKHSAKLRLQHWPAAHAAAFVFKSQLLTFFYICSYSFVLLDGSSVGSTGFCPGTSSIYIIHASLRQYYYKASCIFNAMQMTPNFIFQRSQMTRND